MSRDSLKTYKDKIYKNFNSTNHRVNRINDILKDIKDIKDLDSYFKIFYKEVRGLRRELNAKKYLNSMWYCHD